MYTAPSVWPTGTAAVVGDTCWFHADRSPFSPAKMNAAGLPVPGTTKPVVSLNT